MKPRTKRSKRYTRLGLIAVMAVLIAILCTPHGIAQEGSTLPEIVPDEVLLISENTQITDTIYYDHLTPGVEHRVEGVLMDIRTLAPYLDAQGNEVRAARTFTPEAPEGSVDVEFTMDSRGLAGVTLVCFERIYIGDQFIGGHENIGDEAQMVTFAQPELDTILLSDAGTKLVPLQEDCRVTDFLTYRFVKPGANYRIHGRIFHKDTGEMLAEEWKDLIPEDASGTETMEYTVDTTNIPETQIVCTEEIWLGDYLYCEHSDMDDEQQIIAVTPPDPMLTTLAHPYDMGHGAAAIPEENCMIVDNVRAMNVAPGAEYTLEGRLLDTQSLEQLGESVQYTFTAEDTVADAEMTFFADTSEYAGRTLVVCEVLKDSSGETVASHEDTDDELQMVTISTPEIDTVLTGSIGEKMLLAGGESVLKDVVSYTGLAVRETYTLVSSLADPDTGEILEQQESTFAAEEDGGEVEVTFTIPSDELVGRSIVATEVITLNGKVILEHTDLQDADQTVRFAQGITTTAKFENGNKTITPDGKQTIVDTVLYQGLIPGVEYTVRGEVIYFDDTGADPRVVINPDGSKATAEATFTPEAPDGAIDLSFAVDTSLLEGKTVVCYEELWDVQMTLIAEHKDMYDEAQAVTVREREPEPTPTPTPTEPPEPTPTEPPEPTPTEPPEPTPSTVPTPSEPPIETPPIFVLETPTPSPTITPTVPPAETPSPTVTPTQTPVPSASPPVLIIEPTPSVEPSTTPIPSASATPTASPSLTPTWLQPIPPPSMTPTPSALMPILPPLPSVPPTQTVPPEPTPADNTPAAGTDDTVPISMYIWLAIAAAAALAAWLLTRDRSAKR